MVCYLTLSSSAPKRAGVGSNARRMSIPDVKKGVGDAIVVSRSELGSLFCFYSDKKEKVSNKMALHRQA